MLAERFLCSVLIVGTRLHCRDQEAREQEEEEEEAPRRACALCSESKLEKRHSKSKRVGGVYNKNKGYVQKCESECGTKRGEKKSNQRNLQPKAKEKKNSSSSFNHKRAASTRASRTSDTKSDEEEPWRTCALQLFVPFCEASVRTKPSSSPGSLPGRWSRRSRHSFQKGTHSRRRTLHPQMRKTKIQFSCWLTFWHGQFSTPGPT